MDPLNRLSGLKAPKPDNDARARTLGLAMAAFEDAKDFSKRTQGTDKEQRQSSTVNLVWSSFMNRKFLAGTALATLLVVPAAGYITFELTRSKMEGRQTEVAELVTPKEKIASELETAKTETKPTVTKKLDPTVNTVEPGQPPAPGEVLASSPAPKDGSIAAGQPMSATTVYRSQVSRQKLENNTDFENQPTLDQPNGDRFSDDVINPVKSVAVEPVSTFSIDVDTASYAYARQMLTAGQLPQADSVRVEEMINYFPYDWKPPESAAEAFKANITVMPTPWNQNTRLMHIGIKGYELAQAAQPSANLVFLIDVSGSMEEPNKLPLLKSAFRLLVGKLKPTDTVSIVVYAGNSGVVLEPTKASEREKILEAIDNLSAGGSTAGAEGIDAAYRLAKKAFIKDGVNRVILATDGDFNVGLSSDEELKQLIEQKRKTGIFLSVLGFGTGNYNDVLMQTIAQNGNGTAAYIDTLSEAQKTLVEEAGSSLFPIAKDVKIQVEFNPAAIKEYRLIGYETRALKREDFNNDKIDAGEIGSGHRVTVIYEVTPKGSPAMMNDDLRYGKPAKPTEPVATGPDGAEELAFVKIRYKMPNEDKSQLVSVPIYGGSPIASSYILPPPDDVRFSVAVAAFGQKLKGEDQLSDFTYDQIIDMATKARGDDAFGYRAEFINLVRLAKGLKGE